jgi:acetyl-CoA C-acetyltransferase
MKSVMLAARTFSGDAEIVVAGGMENMSLIHYMNRETELNLVPTMVDGMQKDGLVDAYDNNAFVLTYVLLNINLEKTKISTQFNRMSVQRKLGKMVNFNEVVPVAVPQRKGDPIIVSKDEEFTNVK